MKFVYIKSLIFTLVLALIANALWLVELLQVIGWEGMDWVSYLHYSVFIIALFAVAAYVLPFRWIHHISWMQIGQAALETYPATVVAFFLAKTILFSIYTRLYGYLNGNMLLLLLVVVVLLISFSIHFVTKKSLRRVRWGHGFFVAAGIVTVVPLSIMTVRFFPGFSEEASFVSAVKMGYPFFWIVVMMGVLGLRTAMWKPEIDVPVTQEDILDDLPED